MLLAVLGVLYYNVLKFNENQANKLPQYMKLSNGDLKYDNLLTRNVIKSSATNGKANGKPLNGYTNGLVSNGYANGLNGVYANGSNGYPNGYKNGYHPNGYHPNGYQPNGYKNGYHPNQFTKNESNPIHVNIY